MSACLLCLSGTAFQVIETDENPGDIIKEKAHLSLLHPFFCLSILAEMDMGKVVEVLGAVEVRTTGKAGGLKDWGPLKAAYGTDSRTTLGGHLLGKIQRQIQ